MLSEKLNVLNDTSEKIQENTDQIKDIKVTDKLKFDLLNEQIEIYKNTNLRFSQKNNELETKINNLNKKLINLQNTIKLKDEIISQNNLDKQELEFLKLNLTYGRKCKKSFSNQRGYKFGTKEYRKCVMNKGKLQ